MHSFCGSKLMEFHKFLQTFFLSICNLQLIACKQLITQEVQDRNWNNQMHTHKKKKKPWSHHSCVFPERDVSAESKERHENLVIFTFFFSVSPLFTSCSIWMASRLKTKTTTKSQHFLL